MKINNRTRCFTINSSNCAIFAFVMYLSYEPIMAVLSKIFPSIIAMILTYCIMYAPLFFAMYAKKCIPWDFIILFFIVVLIFAVTYLFHPEYKEWFFEGSYRLTRRIFRPDRYLYMYLFIRVLDTPENILKGLKYGASVLLVYNSYLLLVALRRGYWIINSFGYDMHNAYDLNYGYSHLLIFATFMVLGFRENKIRFYLLAFVSLVEVFLGGSRGPIIYMVALVAILYFYKMRNSKSIKQIVMAMAIFVGVAVLVVVGLDNLTRILGQFLSSIGFGNSRTVQNLINGSISDDNGRAEIWAIAIEMIQKNGILGLGYGAYGDRYVIRPRYIWVGYCHNVFLELLIDYGVIVGSILILIGLYVAIKMLFRIKEEIWRDTFLVFFIASCKLLLYGSYWYCEAFWGAIAVGVGYSMCKKRTKRLYKKRYKQCF